LEKAVYVLIYKKWVAKSSLNNWVLKQMTPKLEIENQHWEPTPKGTSLVGCDLITPKMIIELPYCAICTISLLVKAITKLGFSFGYS